MRWVVEQGRGLMRRGLRTLVGVFDGLKYVFEALKPFADVLAPVALIFFAYKTDEVARTQVNIQELQAEIQRAQISPVFEVYFDDENKAGDHAGAKLRVVNVGSPMLELSIKVDQILELVVSQKETYLSYSWKYVVGGPSFGSDSFGPIHVSNKGDFEAQENTIDVSFMLHLLDERVNELNAEAGPYIVSGQSEFIVTISYRDRSNFSRSEVFYVTQSEITHRSTRPILDVINLQTKNLKEAAERIFKAKLDWHSQVYLQHKSDIP